MMARKISKFLTFAAALLGFLFFLERDRTFAASTVKFKLLRNYAIVIPVTVNGAGPHDFLLDTGTNTTVIYAEFARQLRLRPIDRVELVTTTGSKIVPRARLERLTLGSKSVASPEVLFSDLGEIRAIDPNICGVLGQNVLTQFNYLLNYSERQIEIEDEDELESSLCGDRLSIEWNEGRLTVLAQLETGGKKNLRLVLDSGIPTLLLFATRGESSGLELDHGNPTLLRARTDVGSRIVQQKQLRSLRIGRERFSNLPVLSMEANTASEPRIEDGLLPTNLFRKVYFNHRKNSVIFNPTYP